MEAVAEKLEQWPYKLLDQQVHARLAANLEETAQVAGVPMDMLDRSMKESGCSKDEIEWVCNFPALRLTAKKGGVILCGVFKPSPEKRLMAMAAAFIRNYVDARVVTLFELLPVDGEAPEINPTVLLIPDFCRQNLSKPGHTLTHWQSRFVHSFLLERFTQRRVTVLHVDNLPLVEKEYGESFLAFLVENWTVQQSS